MTGLTQNYAELNEANKPFIFYPFRIRQFLDSSLPFGVCASWSSRYQESDGRILLILKIDGHWIFLTGIPVEQNGLLWTLYDGLRLGHLVLPVCCLALRLCAVLQLEFDGLLIGKGLPQLQPHTCGTLALVHMALVLQLAKLDDMEEIDQLHTHLLLQQIGGTFFGGGQAEVLQQLAELLATKGVPASAASDRAQLVLNKLGLTQLGTIMKNKNVWAALKAAASRPGNLFRLVTAEEQTAYVAQRANNKHGAQVNNHRSKKSAKSAKPFGPVHLDPDQFELDSAHFMDEHELPVEQIKFVEVEADTRRVALCTTSMAQHFLEAPKSISVEALALLFVGTPETDTIDKANLRKIVILAMCRGTKEHTLIFGYIMQLGDSEVQRSFTGQSSAPEVVATQVLKLQIFRDQLQADWHEFVAAPIRALVQRVEALQLCKGANCGTDCAKFHPAVDEQLDNVIFEIWARSFLNEKGHKTTPKEAALFTVFLRIPEGALQRILVSTPVGVYAEPRGDMPRMQDDKYKVIWLPGATHDEAMHQCRTYSKAVCLVRMRTKYGIRVLKDDERTAWAHLRPGVDFVDFDIQLIFELFPLPHGTQRQAVCQLLKDWEWHAKPLQPGKGNFGHMAWRVGSKVPPPHHVMKGFQVDIVITQIKELKQPSHQPHMIASTKTQNIYELLQCQQPLPRLTQTLGSTPQRTHGLRIRAKQPHLKEVRSVLG